MVSVCWTGKTVETVYREIQSTEYLILALINHDSDQGESYYISSSYKAV